MFSFANQVVWVTGSSTGIGRAAAMAFADGDARVIIHCKNNIAMGKQLVAEIQRNGKEALLVHGDVTDSKQVAVMVAEIQKHYGRLDILVNNAGALVKKARLEELDEEIWDQIMDINLKSAFLVSKAVLPLMKSQNNGKIINISSLAARTGGSTGNLAYAVSKGGLSTFTRGLARDLVEYNILVNGVAPGVIDTPFHDKYFSAEVQRPVSHIPMGREGTAEEIVGAILFLASNYANYITGEIIEVNGGVLMN